MRLSLWMVAAPCSFAILSPGAASASSYHQFDYPGAASTCASHISGKGVVTGYANGGTLAAGTPFILDTETGQFTLPKPDVPLGLVVFFGVTLNHTIMGGDLSQTGAVSEFLFHHGVTTMLSGLVANARGINDRGIIFGQTGYIMGGIFGYLKTPEGKETLLGTGSDMVEPMGIDDAGRSVVGTNASGAFFYKDGKFQIINVPSATSTLPSGVDGLGRISGTYYVGSYPYTINGFLLRDGVFQTWNAPGAVETYIMGENERGQIVGCFSGADYKQHGFFATP